MPSTSRCAIMGVLNVTPDSFSDGGRFFQPSKAIAHGLTLHRNGADMVDVGGESTHPGAKRISAEEELGRILPVITPLAQKGVRVSVDTTRADVAREAVQAGATLVNDVSGGRADPAMLPTIAALKVPCVLMHWRGHSQWMHQRAVYSDVVAEVVTELTDCVQRAIGYGIAAERIVLDPGIGFAKNAEHNWTLLKHLSRIQALGYPVLVGTSRKRFLVAALANGEPTDVPAYEREHATTATTALAAAAGVWCVRVHDVRAAVAAVEVTARWCGQRV